VLSHAHHEFAQGIADPKMSSTTALSGYREKRATLIVQDRSLRRENLRVKAFTLNETKADEILRRIRADEEATIWKEEHASIPHPFPGMEFLTGEYLDRI
jgi:adenosine deaminase CECR1